MTCAECGMTVGWDCECNEEYNALIRDAENAEAVRRPPTTTGDPQ